MAWNRKTKWAENLVNLNQTSEERQAKYNLARELGANTSHARRMRDWRRPKILRQYGLGGKQCL